MTQIRQEHDINNRLQAQLFSLVMEAIAPWALSDNGVLTEKSIGEIDNWHLCDVSMHENLARVCVMHGVSRDQYTALVCCLDEPEVLAVSFTSGNLGMLNPYLDGGHKLGADLDGLGCWNVFSVTFYAEAGAEEIRYLRAGKVEEISVNEFNAFSIVDWESSQPIQEYLGVKIDGVWKEPVVAAIPYSIDYIAACWRMAVQSKNGMRSRWNRWITAAFVELCGIDRYTLQHALENALMGEENQIFYQAFEQERQQFLEREKQPLDELLINA